MVKEEERIKSGGGGRGRRKDRRKEREKICYKNTD